MKRPSGRICETEGMNVCFLPGWMAGWMNERWASIPKGSGLVR